MTEKKIKFHILQALFWCANCTLSTYVTAWFLAMGMSSTFISLIIALSMLMAFAGQLFWGRLCDQNALNKEIFIFCLVIAAVLTLAISGRLLEGIRVSVFIYPILMFFAGPLATDLDSWENRCLENNGKSLGISRGCAAAAYSLFHFFYAKQVVKTEYKIIPKAALLLYGIAILFALCMPSVKGKSTKIWKEKNFVKKEANVFQLTKNKRYMRILIITFLIGLGTSPISSMKILLYQNVGKDASFLGVDSLFTSGIQIPLFFLGGVMSHYSSNKRLFTGTSILIAASSAIVLAENTTFVLLGNMAIAAAYPFILLAIRGSVMNEIKPELQTLANGICDAIYSSVSGVIAMIYTGIIVEECGIRILIVISFLLYLLAGVLILNSLKSVSEKHKHEK